MTRTILGCAVVVMLAGAAAADEPSLVLRAKELAGLLDDLHTLAKRAGRDEQAARLKTLLQTQPGKGLKGLDPGKPFGLTVELKARLPESRVWLLLPITDEKAFLAFLGSAGLKPAKQTDGTFQVNFDGVPLYNTALFRFAHGYLYGTIKLSEASAIPEADKLAKPELLLGKSESTLSLAAHLDRIPGPIRKLAVSFLGLQLGAAKDAKPDDETPAQTVLREATIDEATARLKSLFLEGKTLQLDLSLDARRDDLSLSAVLVGKAGTAMAKDIASLAELTSVAGGVVGKEGILGGATRLELPAAMRKAAAAVVDESIARALDQLQAHERETVEPPVKALVPTLRLGLLDAAFHLRPAKSGKVAFVAALRVQNGAKIEEAIRKLLDSLPEQNRKGVKVDAHKAGVVNVHLIEYKSPDRATKDLLGEGPLYFAFRGDGLFLSLGAEALPALKASLETKPATSHGPLVLEGSLDRFAPLFPLIYPDLKKVPDAAKEAFKNSTGKVRLAVTGGERLEAKLSVQTAAITFAGLLDKLRGR